MVKLDRKFASDARRRNTNNTRVYEFCDNIADGGKSRSNFTTKCVMPGHEKALKTMNVIWYRNISWKNNDIFMVFMDDLNPYNPQILRKRLKRK